MFEHSINGKVRHIYIYMYVNIHKYIYIYYYSITILYYMNMLFRKTAERKSCSALRCAALRKSTGMEVKSKNNWPHMFLNCMTYALTSM